MYSVDVCVSGKHMKARWSVRVYLFEACKGRDKTQIWNERGVSLFVFDNNSPEARKEPTKGLEVGLIMSKHNLQTLWEVRSKNKREYPPTGRSDKPPKKTVV